MAVIKSMEPLSDNVVWVLVVVAIIRTWSQDNVLVHLEVGVHLLSPLGHSLSCLLDVFKVPLLLLCDQLFGASLSEYHQLLENDIELHDFVARTVVLRVHLL